MVDKATDELVGGRVQAVVGETTDELEVDCVQAVVDQTTDELWEDVTLYLGSCSTGLLHQRAPIDAADTRLK